MLPKRALRGGLGQVIAVLAPRTGSLGRYAQALSDATKRLEVAPTADQA